MIPNSPGTYALVLRLENSRDIAVGRLGIFEFPAGWYIYVGSAHGSGGLAARVARHLRDSKSTHWHIDYLRPQDYATEVWCAFGVLDWECDWAKALSKSSGAKIPVPRFGASDCPCPSHLIHSPCQFHTGILTDIYGSLAIQRVLLAHSWEQYDPGSVLSTKKSPPSRGRGAYQNPSISGY